MVAIIIIPYYYYQRVFAPFFTKNADAIEIFKLAQRIPVNGVIDPPCNWSKGVNTVYSCSGFCALIHKEKKKCKFLDRIVHAEFQKLGMYCTPPPDHCPEYDAWLKDTLPLTRQAVYKIPNNLLSNFTLNGLISVNYGVGFVFTNNSKAELIWSADFIQPYRDKVRARHAFGTYNTDALYPALDIYKNMAVVDKRCAVIGSEYPWIEAALLETGASAVVTIEYNPIKVVEVPRLFALTPGEFASKRLKDASGDRWDLFDSVWSYSSLEHDGLGRYTDPINPYGDFLTMTKISCMLKPGGLLFLAVPTSHHDEIHFNLHRVYGPIRYPLLYRYFHLVRVFAGDVPNRHGFYGFQPILVLQNKVGCTN